jgi:hypothetical protein
LSTLSHAHRILDLREQLFDIELPIGLVHHHRAFLVGVDK